MLKAIASNFLGYFIIGAYIMFFLGFIYVAGLAWFAIKDIKRKWSNQRKRKRKAN